MQMCFSGALELEKATWCWCWISADHSFCLPTDVGSHRSESVVCTAVIAKCCKKTIETGKKNKPVSSPDSHGEEAIAKAEGGFVGLVSHATCETSLLFSLLQVTEKEVRMKIVVESFFVL